ncbi:MAG: hypothetical protein WCF67_04985 [Chitinophagaceae bacterium]
MRLIKPLIVSVTLITAITWWAVACHKSGSTTVPFEDTPALRPVVAGIADEASGIADSYRNPGFLWVNQDSRQPTEIYLFNHSGQFNKKIFIKNVTNRDWEEISLGNGPVDGKKYLYIGETGDNDEIFNDYIFYRMEEPASGIDTVSQTDAIHFKYPDGPHDSEAFFVDDASKDIYIITKRDAKSKVYKLAYPQSTTSTNMASFVTDLPYAGVVSACYSSSQKEMLIKTYTDIYYYKQSSNQTISNLFAQRYQALIYQQEPQGEAVCFANDATGFFTLSEKSFAAGVNLRFYKRK